MPHFKAKRITYSYTQKNLAPPDKVFPLLCPVREKEWLDGWEYEMVYSESGLVEEGCIFTTRNPGEPETTWVVTRHDRGSHRIEFVRITPGSRVVHIRILLKADHGGATRACIRYTYTGITEEGNSFVDSYTEEQFNSMMVWWERSINHFLATGKKLKQG